MRVATLSVLLLGALTAALAQPSPPAGRWAVAVFPSGAEFALEIAADPAARRRGYMFRDEVAPGEGMLFLFDRSGHHAFWMRNCRVSLDIIWLDQTFHVVEVAHDQPPCPANGRCPQIVPTRAARYVLEVAGGRAKEEGLRVGDAIYIHTDRPLNR